MTQVSPAVGSADVLPRWRQEPRTQPGDTRPAYGPLGSLDPLGPLIDRFGRVHRHLRISITDRCNLRCTYCMPAAGVSFGPRTEILTFEEITRVATVAHRLGINALRITGGEPLLRPGAVELIGALARIGFDDLALTTNGTRLAELADGLARAGLQRVNLSCDSLRPERFAAIRRGGQLQTVLDAMDAAEAAGLRPVKVNVVLMAGTNDDEIVDFAAFARRTGRIVRLIEFMPLDAGGRWRQHLVVPSSDVLARIGARWPLEPLDGADTDVTAPATGYRFADGAPGEIGVVASVTQPFCGTCNRLRLTANGSVCNCLFSDDEHSVRAVLQDGGSDADIAAVFADAVRGKRAGHGKDEPGLLHPPRRSMSMIGG